MLNWPSQKLRRGRRSLSDHRPIYMEEDAKDCGPKLFKLFNWWLNKKSFVDLVESKWNSYNIVGHASYRFKEKLKRLKVDIKQWKSLHAGNPDPKIEKLIQEIEEWDTIDDTFGLEDDEAEKRKMLMGKLLANWKHKEAELCQMAKLKWAKQGDANSSLFHRMINKRAKVNDINGIRIGDRWVDSVKDVKGEITSHFSLHFLDPLSERPKLKADIFNQSISSSDKAWLESPFSEADIKQAIWDCESDASPGPDGFTFGFFKKLWTLMKADCIELLSEFHTHGKIENIRVMKGILRIFEYISGLKVNFYKSNLHGMFLEESFIVETERVTNCNIFTLPMSYLGMKIGDNSHRKNEWKELAQKLKSRIMKWDKSSISLAGRATLIQSVLSAMPIYQLSLFLLPKSVIKYLTAIQRNFLWGGTENFRKTPWARWGWVCQKKFEEGFGVRELGIFNKALLHKWVWRILRERESLWVKIL
ncbi:hypothetical protein ACS0TY_000495 [Phlomoides rotata]